MTEDPQQPEGEAPDEETPEDVTGPPGDQAEEPSGEEHPGPEIEGVEELAQAAEQVPEGAEPAEDAEPAAEPAAEAPAEESAEAEASGEEETTEDEASAERPRPGARRRPQAEGSDAPDVIPGAHLEPDLVLEEQRPAEGEFAEYAQYEEGATPEGDAEGETQEEVAVTDEEAVAHTPLDLAADARYRATGKRKSAVARVILRPGEGTYTINGRHLDEYFPRVRLQRMASQPLEATGNQTRMDVVARIHGGGVSAQATALRHGIARALVEADPSLRGELKRRGYLTRDPRVKERKKAGLKKARKRPQFSKR
jgi:small subunit ribosomal protein S9